MSLLSKLFGEKFETQSDLGQILSDERNSADWKRAAGKLEDQDLIMQALTRGPLAEKVRQSHTQAGGIYLYDDLFDSLAKKITDSVIAKKVVLECPYITYDSAKHFAQMIKDQKDIEYILLHWDSPIYYYDIFLDKVKDENILLNLAKKASKREIRFASAEKLGNHDIMDALIEEDPEESLLSKVHDPEVLKRIAQNKKLSDLIRFRAALLLKDAELIKSLAEKMQWTPALDIRLSSFIKESPDDILLWIINSHQRFESSIRKEAVSHIKDPSLLDDAAEQCENEEGRFWAYVRSPKYSQKMERNGIALSNLHSGELEIREKTADQLISLAQTDPEILLPIWNYLKKTIEQPVVSERMNKHDLEEAGRYQYDGIGKKFPERPAAKTGE